MLLEPHEIKRRLGFGCVTALADQTNRNKGHVSHVLNRKRRDRKVEVAAARKLRMRVDELFPPVAAEA